MDLPLSELPLRVPQVGQSGIGLALGPVALGKATCGRLLEHDKGSQVFPFARLLSSELELVSAFGTVRVDHGQRPRTRGLAGKIEVGLDARVGGGAHQGS